MSIFFKRPVVRASVIIAALGFGAVSVMAQPVAVKPIPQGASGDILLVANNKKKNSKNYRHYDRKKRHWKWDKRYGHRYRHKRHGYHYYYGGWWYPRPYWRYNNPGIYINLNL